MSSTRITTMLGRGGVAPATVAKHARAATRAADRSEMICMACSSKGNIESRTGTNTSRRTSATCSPEIAVASGTIVPGPAGRSITPSESGRKSLE